MRFVADLADPDNTEGLLVAGAFAAEGYIVVAPNYVGYDTSTLGYHPYLHGEQQASDVVDALTAARSALPTADAPATTDGGQLFVTGYDNEVHRLWRDGGTWRAEQVARLPGAGKGALSTRHGVLVTSTDGSLVRVRRDGDGWSADAVDRRESARSA